VSWLNPKGGPGSKGEFGIKQRGSPGSEGEWGPFSKVKTPPRESFWVLFGTKLGNKTKRGGTGGALSAHGRKGFGADNIA